MHACAEEERDEGGGVFVDFHGGYGRMVDVSKEKVMNRSIPIAIFEFSRAIPRVVPSGLTGQTDPKKRCSTSPHKSHDPRNK